jgi:hypothetical protein
MGNASQAVIRIIATIIIAIIGGLILGAIVHFLGDWGWAVLILYILIGFSTSGPMITDIDSGSVLVIVSIINSILVFFIMSRLLVMVFGPAFTFNTSLFGLSPTITGYLLTIVCGLLSVSIVHAANN